ncbi:MAG: hypothetical protein FJ147_01935 [Deltaproteobacteria bacterium]|nr:hypothetical protein [Deltaproteobacteria bacterium]
MKWGGSLWLVLPWLLIASISAAERSATTQMPCADWETRFSQRLTHTTIPEPLVKILAGHKGYGFATTFTEEKRITVLRTPLTSSGQLVFLPPRGLYRQLQKPFAQELVITPDAIFQRQANGPTHTLALDALPGAKAFVSAFLALFSGSWDTLYTHFDVYFSHQEARWQLGLKPTNATMARSIACLVLEGQQAHITSLWIQETSSDVTHDHFLDPHMLPEPQWSNYQSQFSWAR